MELHFLGTGAGLPSKRRNVTSLVLDLLAERGRCWMFDCGEGTQHQLLHSHIKLSRVNKLFITHLHGDHIFGIPGLLSSRSFHCGVTDGDNTLDIYGPPGLSGFIKAALGASSTHLTYPIVIHEVPQDDGVVFEDTAITVRAAWLSHGIPSLGYRIEEKSRPGVFFPDRAQALGLQPGPLYAQLQAGQAVISPDGRTVHPRDVMGPPRQGRRVTILGDTRPCKAISGLAQDADVLVHEATFRATDNELAVSYNHSTAVDAAEVAATSGVRQLILTHISARYDTDELAALEAEARAIFPHTQIAADFFTVKIARCD